jgi:hypothetical protein
MYFITVSEMVGTEGEKIARQVAGMLNYDYYGEEELLKAADELGFVKDLKKLDEKGPTFLKNFLAKNQRSIWIDYSPSSMRSQRKAMLYSLAREASSC